MKSLLSILILLTSFSTYAETLPEILNILDNVYQEAPNTFNGGKLGMEILEEPTTPISQENIVAELERNLEQDEQWCEYETITGLQENFQVIKDSMKPRAARIFRKLRNDGYIAHVSSRVLTFEEDQAGCTQKQIMLVLNDASLVWLDY